MPSSRKPPQAGEALRALASRAPPSRGAAQIRAVLPRFKDLTDRQILEGDVQAR
jgi:hypothetical protein